MRDDTQLQMQLSGGARYVLVRKGEWPCALRPMSLQGHPDANVGGLRALVDVNLAPPPGAGPLQRGIYVLCHLRSSGWFSS